MTAQYVDWSRKSSCRFRRNWGSRRLGSRKRLTTSTSTTAIARYKSRRPMASVSRTVSVAMVKANAVEKMGWTQVPGVQQYIREIMTEEKRNTPGRPGRYG